ncbi:hypothetical protein BH09GEM1_BH09GEM1_19040 [soil metagenome]
MSVLLQIPTTIPRLASGRLNLAVADDLLAEGALRLKVRDPRVSRSAIR